MALRHNSWVDLVSIHAPARGATPCNRVHIAVVYSFNPRARTGRDDKWYLIDESSKGFNPRARTGRDESRLKSRLFFLEFQSTRPHGARRL